MRKVSAFIVLLMFSLIIIGCQNDYNKDNLIWGETAKTKMLEITPLKIEIGNEENQIEGQEVNPSYQLAIMDINLKNISAAPIKIDRDFYYDSFGISVENEPSVGRMDTDAFPFDGVFLGGLGENESVDTRLVIYHKMGDIKLVFDSNSDIANGYEVSWEIE